MFYLLTVIANFVPKVLKQKNSVKLMTEFNTIN
jgi:hypothetical protein